MKTTQTQSVIAAMKQNGGYATFKQLYDLVDTSAWNTKTPEATIRRIVQNEKYFFKVRRGLFALSECKDNIPNYITLESYVLSSIETCVLCGGEDDLRTKNDIKNHIKFRFDAYAEAIKDGEFYGENIELTNEIVEQVYNSVVTMLKDTFDIVVIEYETVSN